METVNLNYQQHLYMHFDTFIRTPGPIMNCNGIPRGLVNRYGTLVGPDLSRPSPIMNINKISTTHSSMQYLTYFVNVHDRPPPVTIWEPYRLARAQHCHAERSTVMLSATLSC